MQTAVAQVSALIRRHAHGASDLPRLQTAARLVARYYPMLVAETLDRIGCWPSSERDLFALQTVAGSLRG